MTHTQTKKPYSPWMNAAEGCIRELNGGTSRKMLKTLRPFGIIALNWRNISVRAQSMTFTKPVERPPRPLCPAILLTSAISVNLAGMTGLCSVTMPLPSLTLK